MATGICTKNFVNIGPAIQRYACGQTDRQKTDCNTPLAYRGEVIISSIYITSL